MRNSKADPTKVASEKKMRCARTSDRISENWGEGEGKGEKVPGCTRSHEEMKVMVPALSRRRVNGLAIFRVELLI
jgi:hypothetical protein